MSTPTGAARTPSPAAVLYGHYRDAILVAEEDYRNRELTAEFSEDEGVRARWREVEAPSIRRQIEQLYADWEDKGKKSAIESARQRLRVHAAAEAAATWEKWRLGLNPDLDMPTDILLNRFAGTSFTPADLAGAVDWPRLTLERAEILALAAEADPELKRRLGGEGQTTDVERIVFECRSAGLDRSWLPKDLFAARFWRLPLGDEPLSDGADPPKGRCPAHAVGVVFARNIQVVRRAAGGAEEVRLQQFQAVNIFNLAEAQPVASRSIQPAQLRATGRPYGSRRTSSGADDAGRSRTGPSDQGRAGPSRPPRRRYGRRLDSRAVAPAAGPATAGPAASAGRSEHHHPRDDLQSARAIARPGPEPALAGAGLKSADHRPRQSEGSKTMARTLRHGDKGVYVSAIAGCADQHGLSRRSGRRRTAISAPAPGQPSRGSRQSVVCPRRVSPTPKPSRPSTST